MTIHFHDAWLLNYILLLVWYTKCVLLNNNVIEKIDGRSSYRVSTVDYLLMSTVITILHFRSTHSFYSQLLYCFESDTSVEQLLTFCFPFTRCGFTVFILSMSIGSWDSVVES